MQINDKTAIIFLGIGLLAALAILAVSIYAVLQRKGENLLLWGKWTLLVPLGFAPGLYLGTTVISDINETLGLLFMGFSLGVAQWFIIRPYINVPSHWILATVIGWASAISLTQYESHVVVYFCGLFLGVTQFLVIGKQYSRSAWWILANLAGIACIVFQVDMIYSLLSHFDWRFFAVAGLSTLMYSGITGATLVWLLRRDDRNMKVQHAVIKSAPSSDGTSKENAS
jgi:hypothetical protein